MEILIFVGFFALGLIILGVMLAWPNVVFMALEEKLFGRPYVLRSFRWLGVWTLLFAVIHFAKGSGEVRWMSLLLGLLGIGCMVISKGKIR